MSRYIDADEIKESILDKWGVDPKYLDDSLEASKDSYVLEWVNSAPSIDIVRCSECKYDGTWKCPWRNTQVPRYPSANDFCSYGEREGE